MLSAAFIIIAGAALLGTLLAVQHMRAAAAPWQIAILHGLLGIGGLICLAWALRGPPRGLEQGTSSFGLISAMLIALAALIGGGIAVWRLRGRRLSGTLIGVHATLAIGGFVILAAYIFAG
jgi:hypothetical protein